MGNKGATVRLKPVRLQRVLVDLNTEARTWRTVEQAVAQLALDRGDRRGEEALGGEAVGALAARRPGGRCERGRRASTRRDPDRSVERAREVSGQPRPDRLGGRLAPDLREL